MDDLVADRDDDLFERVEHALDALRTLIAAHPRHGIYLRLLNPFGSDDPRSMPIHAMLREIDRMDPAMVCNRPSALASNFSKLLHVRRYRELLDEYGIRSPKSLLTNRFEAGMLAVVGMDRDCIVKGASARKSICVPLSGAHENPDTSIARMMFIQERIDGPDIRVHATASGVVAEGFVSTEVDYRFSERKSAFQVRLPTRIEAFCKRLLAREGAIFAGIDFKVDGQGNWYFLEANGSPAFQGFDRRSGGAIVGLLDVWDRKLREPD